MQFSFNMFGVVDIESSQQVYIVAVINYHVIIIIWQSKYKVIDLYREGNTEISFPPGLVQNSDVLGQQYQMMLYDVCVLITNFT